MHLTVTDRVGDGMGSCEFVIIRNVVIDPDELIDDLNNRFSPRREWARWETGSTLSRWAHDTRRGLVEATGAAAPA